MIGAADASWERGEVDVDHGRPRCSSAASSRPHGCTITAGRVDVRARHLVGIEGLGAGTSAARPSKRPVLSDLAVLAGDGRVREPQDEHTDREQVSGQ